MDTQGRSNGSGGRRGPRRLRGLLLGVLLLAAVDQLVLRLAIRDGHLGGVQLAPYSPPLFTNEQRGFLRKYREQLEADAWAPVRLHRFDAELGWCVPAGRVWDGARIGEHGGRLGSEPFPIDPEERGSWVATIGCSYTFGSEVGDAESYPAQLDAAHPELVVGNFGVPGFGLDQVLLRFRRDVAPLGPAEVWLGVFPGAAQRAMSSFPPLTYRWRARTIHFKPRASVDAAGRLELHPNPAREPGDIVRLLDDPARFHEAVAGDPWIARVPAAFAAEGSHWSHATALGRIALTLADRRARASAGGLHDPDSAMFRVNVALVEELAREVDAIGATLRVAILPGGPELEAYSQAGGPPWRPFLDELDAREIPWLDLSTSFFESGDEPGLWAPMGHYGARGNALVARVLADAWLPVGD